MDKTDERILDIMKGDARISFQELADKVGMSRVGVMKRVRKLEEEGIIRQYNTCIYREDEFTMFIDLEIKPEKYDKVLKYITTKTVFIRQIFLTTGESRIHMVAVAPAVEDLNYLVKMIRKKCGEDLIQISAHGVKEVIKDVYGGVGYERKDLEDNQ